MEKLGVNQEKLAENQEKFDENLKQLNQRVEQQHLLLIEKIENVQKHRVESDRILEDKNQLVTQQSQVDVSLV